MVRFAPLGDVESGFEGVGGAQPVRMLDRQQDLARSPWIANPGAEHEGMLDIACPQQRAEHRVERFRLGGGQRPPEECAPDRGRADVVGSAEHRFEEDPLRCQPGEVDTEVGATDVGEQPS